MNGNPISGSLDSSKRIKVSWRALKIVGVIAVVALTLKFGIEAVIISVVTFGFIGFAIARATIQALDCDQNGRQGGI